MSLEFVPANGLEYHFDNQHPNIPDGLSIKDYSILLVLEIILDHTVIFEYCSLLTHLNPCFHGY